ncbi:hypothetical protein [Flavimaricola marinus]|uniref:Neutral zinc metallopeptidase n=1 Tax=Flavimaricola marinus TaxID=1819565 RepID=A0A238LEM1_9RHOB|nr:hypothetical protein [Flavimaricola marinus]SMY07360.1 hypothetical protein LOM8899_01495 [Flavimaricola marinus]
MKNLVAVALCLIVANGPLPGWAETPLDGLIRTATTSFPALPEVRHVPSTIDLCGGELDAPGLYCTSEGAIYLAETPHAEQQLFALAHLYGHGIQVQYGLADIALARILADRSQENEVRRKVTSQVECMAGVLLARAGVQMPPLTELFDEEPMTDAHWGRSPVRRGPAVSIGLALRAEWFGAGYSAGEPSACSVEDLPADLIVAADEWPAER